MNKAGRGIATLVAALMLWAAFPLSSNAQQERTRSSCDMCHSQLEFLRQNTDSMARARAVLVSDTLLIGSAHARLSCVGCHNGFSRFPHRNTSTKPCASCHAEAAQAWQSGVHLPDSSTAGAQCSSCHGAHDVKPVSAFKSAGAAGMNRTCAGCHQERKLVPHTAHADTVLCSGCHRAHDTQPAYGGLTRASRREQLQTCGSCHRKAAAEFQRFDVHRACTECHESHGTATTEQRCIDCHAKYAGAYSDSYHGYATELGSRKAATCADCHVQHAIAPAQQTHSSIAPANLVKTCSRCHKTANASFTKFDPHTDPHDSDNPLIFWSYRFMTALLVGTMVFFGVHTVLWLIRLRLEKDQDA